MAGLLRGVTGRGRSDGRSLGMLGGWRPVWHARLLGHRVCLAIGGRLLHGRRLLRVGGGARVPRRLGLLGRLVLRRLLRRLVVRGQVGLLRLLVLRWKLRVLGLGSHGCLRNQLEQPDRLGSALGTAVRLGRPLDVESASRAAEGVHA
ncbi:MAG: hypothetical protein ACYC6Y_01585 [Thermoguttaceae bacterium]